MRKLMRNALVTGAVAATMVGLAGSPAFAHHGNWDVEPINDPTTEVVGVEAVSTDTVLTNGTDTLQCDTATAYGLAFDDLHGDSVGLDHVANIDDTLWEQCEGPLGIEFEVTHDGVWELYADSVDPNNSNIIHGRLVNVSADISGFLCNATVSGSVNGTYNNVTKVLTVNEPQNDGLTVSNASCLGVISNGDQPGFNGTFTVTPGITIVPN